MLLDLHQQSNEVYSKHGWLRDGSYAEQIVKNVLDKIGDGRGKHGSFVRVHEESVRCE